MPYVVRTAIDLEIRVGAWYEVHAATATGNKMTKLDDFLEKAEPRVLAFDIECTKAPLKFPNAAMDQIYMISYMLDGQGYLIINREIVSADIDDFEYTPKPEYPGPFIVWNEPNEEALIRKWFEHVCEVRPQVFVTFNGDFFDWPFIEARAAVYGMNMLEMIGVGPVGTGAGTEYRSRAAAHMDCLCWVRRDSYLPSGSHGLKAVTKSKLGYDPVEIDPEDMLPFAAARPHDMAAYSVSDAVATYYLYMKYVHNFIFSLCTIIPMGPDDVLRKGSGTLCEQLLMVEAYRGNIVCPNKQISTPGALFKGHLLETETYIGGRVECLESGVFRDDIPTEFNVDPGAYQLLLDQLDAALKFAVEVESGKSMDDVENYAEVRAAIADALVALRDRPQRVETPRVYHLDVSAMYPNIILTNRLQPSAMVTEDVCASCTFNKPEATCKRRMDWTWRGEYYPLTRGELRGIQAQLDVESVGGVPYSQLPRDEQMAALKQRVRKYSQRVYKRVKDITEEQRTATICQRENPFYVATVMAFRDRRYEYKRLTKTWSKKAAAAESSGDKLALEEAKGRVVLFDSLQLAHKCILNSFYGYVMRAAARWMSMEMAGVVTYTGAQVILGARVLVERIGRALELDTDGIWCILPSSFPEDFKFKLKDGSSLGISYPCVMLNHTVHANFTNHQYATLAPGGDVGDESAYSTHSECSIFFEVDGPYAAMVLPASQEEGKLLKKRYAVFNFDGSLAELKGFELKRRGELKIIKVFQSEVFAKFLQGDTLSTCYDAAADVANYWLDVLTTRGQDIADEELIEFISEARNLSRTIDGYGSQKSTTLTTARRMGEFLGADMIKDAGLTMKMVIASKPLGAPVTERAIPVTIFSAEEPIKKHFLRKWLRDPACSDFDVRSLVDWQYYIERLGAAIQKIITIPAALQGLPNPVPRVVHPDWVLRQAKDRAEAGRQQSITSFFSAPSADAAGAAATPDVLDMEDIGASAASKGAKTPKVTLRKKDAAPEAGVVDVEDDSQGSGEAQEIPPDRAADFKEWLAFRREQWKRRRGELARTQAAAARQVANNSARAARGAGTSGAAGSGSAAGPPVVPSGTNDILSFVGQAAATAAADLAQEWQLVTVQPGRQRGTVDLWAFTQGTRLTKIQVEVPATVYINYKRHRKDLLRTSGLTLVQRTLPHGHTAKFLYRYDAPASRSLSAWLHQAVTSPDIEGVYEAQVPALLRARVLLGSAARLAHTTEPTVSTAGGTKRSRAADASHVVRLQDLSMVPTRVPLPGMLGSVEPAAGGTMYLSPAVVDMRLGVLYTANHRTPSGIQYGLAALWVPAKSIRAMLLEVLIDQAVAGAAQAGRAVERASVAAELKNTPDLWQRAMPLYASALQAQPLACGGTLRVWAFGVDASTTSASSLREQAAGAFSAALQGVHMVPGAVNVELAVGSERDMWAHLSAALRDVRSAGTGSAPFMVTSATQRTIAALFDHVPALHEVPLVPLDVDQAHGQELRAVDSALGARWVGRAVGAIARVVAHAPQDFMTRAALASSLAVPVGALPTRNSTSELLDTLYARALEKAGHCLWASDSTFPDLGTAGLTQADAVFSDASMREDSSLLAGIATNSAKVGWSQGFTGAKLHHRAAGQAERVDYDGRAADGTYPLRRLQVAADSPGMALPGLYGTPCVEVQLSLSMAALAAMNEDGEPSGDISTAAAEALSILRGQVRNWLDAVARGGVAGAASARCLRWLHAWLSSPASLLFDPALRDAVHALQSHTWRCLMSLVRRRGLRVVHSSPTRLILTTGRLGLKGAMDAVSECLNAAARHPELYGAELSVSRVWTSLLFMDECNYGGLALQPAQVAASMRDTDHALDMTPEPWMCWACAAYLPSSARGAFDTLVSKWLSSTVSKLNSAAAKLLAEPGTSSVPCWQRHLSASQEAEIIQALPDLLVQQFNTSFFPRLQKVTARLAEMGHDPEAFEEVQPPGCILTPEYPALEFVKTVCAVLGTAASVRDAVLTARAALLRQIHVPDFSDEARWEHPAAAIVLPLVCANEACMRCRDVDLTRDPILAPRVDKDVPAGAPVQRRTHTWACDACLTPYSRDAIEDALVAAVERATAAYQRQDLYCAKTAAVRDVYLSEYSKDSGKWVAKCSPADIKDMLRIYQSLAQAHDMPWLGAALTSFVQHA